jgi:hypothetical protein
MKRHPPAGVAAYAALDDDATEADFVRAGELCPADPDHLNELR